MNGNRLLRLSAATFARIAAVALLAFLAATAIRYGLIERDDLGPACDLKDAPWWCPARMFVIRAFLHQGFSITSLALVAVAAWRRAAWAAYLAIAVGTAGVVLYDFRGSALGLIGAALVLARMAGQRQQDAESQRR